MQLIKNDNNILITLSPTKVKVRSERAEIISKLYDLYVGDKLGIKKANWKRYISWLKSNHLPNSPENQVKFKKSKMFIKPLKINSFCYFLAHLKDLKDLRYILSEAKDCNNRGKSPANYIIGSCILK